MNPDHYVARGTFATRDVRNAPLASNSADVAAFVNELPKRFLKPELHWLKTGANLGGDGDQQVQYHDNIPIYTVDSSNPHQEFAQFWSTNSRVTTFSKLVEMTSGRIPLPSWAKPSKGGDHALAIFDVATGIWRSYYQVQAQADGSFYYGSAGYWYGDKGSLSAGNENYFLGLIQGSSSVIGISNELTQIGMEEVKRGEINHVVSVTFPDYAADKISFPAKLTDGSLQDAHAPVAGQMFRLPADFDVDAWAAKYGVDPVSAMIAKAVQKYGGIVSDRNRHSMAFNFENPYGMAPFAQKGLNAWKVEAPVIEQFAPNHFPWHITEWLPVGYAEVQLSDASTPVDVASTAAPLDVAPTIALDNVSPTADEPAEDQPATVLPEQGLQDSAALGVQPAKNVQSVATTQPAVDTQAAQTQPVQTQLAQTAEAQRINSATPSTTTQPSQAALEPQSVNKAPVWHNTGTRHWFWSVLSQLIDLSIKAYVKISGLLGIKV